MSEAAAARLRQEQFDLELEELRKAKREPLLAKLGRGEHRARPGKTFVVRWGGMLRGAGTSKVGREYQSKEGFELFVPGETLLAKEFEVTIRAAPSKRQRKLDIARMYLGHATSSPEHAEELLEALAAVDREGE